MKRDSVKQYLQRSSLFQEFSQDELESISASSHVKVIPQGELVFQQGEASDFFYIIAIGEVELSLHDDTKGRSIVGRIGPGGHFGETSILTHRPHSLTSRALSDLVLICFDEDVFLNVLLGDKRIHLQLERALSERLRLAFHDTVRTTSTLIKEKEQINTLFENVILFRDGEKVEGGRVLNDLRKSGRGHQSQSGKKTRQMLERFGENLDPILLTGEPGTGRRLIAKQIHLKSSYQNGTYIEVDLRGLDRNSLAEKLFGIEQDESAFSQIDQVGIFEQSCGGTVVLLHAEYLSEAFQQKFVRLFESGMYFRIGGSTPVALQSRLVFISDTEVESLRQSDELLPDFVAAIGRQWFSVPPLREHKRDLPLLVDHYLKQFCKEYGKNIHTVSPETLGVLMNYDWPGNLTELSSVIERAVMLAQKNEILSEQILLGLPKTEGKWEFNLLRISWIRNYLQSKVFPALPRFLVAGILLTAILALFFGTTTPQNNIGLTLSWSVGWPLLFFSFFFLARLWCSVCTLAMPGFIAQWLIKPKRGAPQFIVNYSGWIMAILCIALIWIELIWNAYENPYLTGGIILVVTVGSLVTSVIYQRRVWCRYLCPLGAINAIFAMPSILELRSTRSLCLNKCQEHICYVGEEDKDGCPMFRHPFLVDNNKDCIFCGRCIKVCGYNSIQLNVRLAPQELWSIQGPRRADSFLIVALAGILFPYALREEFYHLIQVVAGFFCTYELYLPEALIGSVLFFGIVLVFQLGYLYLAHAQAPYARVSKKTLLPLLGYGFIPLVLGGYLALHFEIFISEAWRIVPNIQELFGFQAEYVARRLLSEDGTSVLQSLTVLGGLLASLYAVYRIIARLCGSKAVTSEMVVFPFSFQITLAILYLFIL